MHEKILRKYLDYRVGYRIKHPVIIPEKQFMEYDKGSVKINGHVDCQQCRQYNCRDRGNKQITEISFLSFQYDDYNSEDESNSAQNIKAGEDIFHLCEMPKAALRCFEGRKSQISPKKGEE
jgi:hypothetical protein